MSTWSIIGPILTATLASISAFAVAWVSSKYSLQNSREERKQEREVEEERRKLEADRQAAKDLDAILYPAIYSLELSRMIEQPLRYNANWFNYLIYDESKDLDRELIRILNSLKANVSPNIVIELIQQTLLEKYDVAAFLKRYNTGDYRNVKIDVQKLNEDIAFVNNVLGKHYEQFPIIEK